MQAVAVVTVALFFGTIFWALLTLGLTYLARDAQILDRPRKWIIGRLLRRTPKIRELVAGLLSCGECTSFWTSMVAAATVLAVVAAAVLVPGWIWLLVPLLGPCGVGLFYWTSRRSPAVAARLLADKLAALIREEDQSHG